MKTYSGSCHCGAIRFEADIELGHGTIRCNCSFCRKIRCWAAMVKPASFRLIAGQTALAEYQFGSKTERHFFCKHCGVRPFGHGNSPRFGAFYGVSIHCLDGLSADDLANLPITYVDGANDTWDASPPLTAHL
jgi:hypothetical protein